MYVYVHVHKHGSRKIRASTFKTFTKRESYVVRFENNSMTYILCMYINSYAWFVSNAYKPLYLFMYLHLPEYLTATM